MGTPKIRNGIKGTELDDTEVEEAASLAIKAFEVVSNARTPAVAALALLYAWQHVHASTSSELGAWDALRVAVDAIDRTN